MSSLTPRLVRSLLAARSLHQTSFGLLQQQQQRDDQQQQEQQQQQQQAQCSSQSPSPSNAPCCSGYHHHSFTPIRSFSTAPQSPPPNAHTQAMQLANALASPAKSLKFERAPQQLPRPLDTQMGRFLLTMLGFYSHKSQMLHGGQALYEAIKEQCEDGALIKAFNLDPGVFFSTYTLLSLHMWLLVHRLGSRTDRESRDFKQRLYDNFQNDVDRRVHKTVVVGVGKWLKQLETVFYSSGMALDKVLSGESQETFTEVILRHHFGSDASKKSQAALLAKYLQRELHCLQLTDDEAILRGQIRFSQEPFEAARAAAAAAAAQRKAQQRGQAQGGK